MDIQAMNRADAEEALAREEAVIQDLRAQRAAVEPGFRALTRQTLLLKTRKQLDQCEKTKAEAHALSLKMADLRQEELRHAEVKDQLVARIQELDG